MTPKTVNCTEELIKGRLKKATQFLEAAATVHDLADDEADVADAYVTLCVHAGIAAADVLCCRALGEHAQGDNHNEAIALLAKVERKLANDLRVLLGMKTRAGYGHSSVNAQQRKRAERAAQHLVEAAR
jgi:hypothetical protein